MASIQSSVNSLFSTALAASVTGSRAFRESALGKRMSDARAHKAELKNLNKAIETFAPGGKVNPNAKPQEIEKLQGLQKTKEKTSLELAALTGKTEHLTGARDTLQKGESLKKDIVTVQTEQRGKAAQEAEDEYRKQQQIEAAEEYEAMSEAEKAEARAAGAAAEEIIMNFGKKLGGK